MDKKITNEELLKTIFKNENELKEIYKEKYYDMLLRQYSIYIDITERLGSRRDTQNSFFLALNTFIITGIGFCVIHISNTFYFPILLSLLGLFFTSFWHRLTVSWRSIKDVAYRLISLAETKMPMSGFEAEDMLLKEKESYKLFIPFTKIEEKFPLYFAFAYSLIIAIILSGQF